MNMYSKNQYLKALVEKRGYLLKSKKEKSKLLDEYCKTTGQNRNYVIRKIRTGTYLKLNFGKRKRKPEKKLKPNSLTFYIRQPKVISLT
jgi:hypothetical protein